MARPIATRWRCPPDSALGRRSRYSVSWSLWAAAFTAASISSLDFLAILSANCMFSRTVMCG